MAVASDSFTGVDLSRLPAPDVVETLSFEAILAEALAKFTEFFPDFDATVESDPVYKVIQVFAYRELVLRQRVNDAARAVMPAFARGADLDNLAAVFGIERFELIPANPETGAAAVLESDESFRRRMVLAPEGYSVAGPEGAYIFHALSADSDVLDASAVSPEPDDIKQLVQDVLTAQGAASGIKPAVAAALDAADWPGDVTVTVLSRSGTGAPGVAVIDAVEARLSSTDVRPMTDRVTVQAADVVDFAVEATLTFLSGPDRSVVMAAAQARLADYLATSLRLGRDVTRAGIIAALHPEGVQNIDLVSPAADIVLNRQQAGYCTGVTLIDGGVGE